MVILNKLVIFLSKEMVRKSWVHEVRSNMSRLIEEKIVTLEVELSSNIAKINDDVYQKLRLKSLNQIVLQM